MEEKILSRVDETLEQSIAELFEFLSIPTVSADPTKVSYMVECSKWLQKKLENMGISAKVMETSGHPIVFGSHCPFPDRPTILIYGHYDVQPEEPLEEWKTSPFTPTIEDGYIYARGASDDKGQLFTHIKALEIIKDLGIKLPLNIKVLLEGEEEIGSPSLEDFIEKHKEEIRADVIIISDGSKYSKDIPAITYGLRGLAYMEIEVTGPKCDLHSGVFGGLVRNPINALSQILANLIDEKNRVKIPGFYDDVVEIELWEKEEMERLSPPKEEILATAGVKELLGEEGQSILELKTAQPTLDINGIWGGYSGEGSKTVIPSKAGAKVSMRLVPNQSYQKISNLFSDFVKGLCPRGVDVTVKTLSGTNPVIVSRNLKEVEIARKVLKKVFAIEPVFIREGGSIPVVSTLREKLGIEPILLLGWGSPGDGPHGPNERFSIEDFSRGIKASSLLICELASLL